MFGPIDIDPDQFVTNCFLVGFQEIFNFQKKNLNFLMSKNYINETCRHWELYPSLFITSPTRDSNYSKKASLVQIFLRIWTKLAFSNNLKVDQTCLLTRDPEFRREKNWTKLAFSKQVSHVI